jgi:hypothetical protein
VTQSEFLPLNPFEITLVGAMRGEIPRAEFFPAFMESELAIPTSTDVFEDGSGITPFFFDKEGAQMLAVYTHRDRVKHLGKPGIYCLIMRGRVSCSYAARIWHRRKRRIRRRIRYEPGANQRHSGRILFTPHVNYSSGSTQSK